MLFRSPTAASFAGLGLIQTRQRENLRLFPLRFIMHVKWKTAAHQLKNIMTIKTFAVWWDLSLYWLVRQAFCGFFSFRTYHGKACVIKRGHKSSNRLRRLNNGSKIVFIKCRLYACVGKPVQTLVCKFAYFSIVWPMRVRVSKTLVSEKSKKRVSFNVLFESSQYA